MASIVRRRVGALAREQRNKLLKDLEAAREQYEAAKQTAARIRKAGRTAPSPGDLEQVYRLKYNAIGIKHGVVLPPLKFE